MARHDATGSSKSAPQGDGAPEVTPEMIAAGVVSLEESLGDYLPPDWPSSPLVVRKLLLAAFGAARR